MDNLFSGSCILIVMLIITHAVISRLKRPPEHKKGTPGHWSYPATLLVSSLLLIIYIAGAWYLYSVDTSRPHVGSLSIVPLIIICPGIIFQLFFLAYSLSKRKFHAKRIRARLLSIVLGFILAYQVVFHAQTVAMQRFEEHYQPLVEIIQANLPHPCNPNVAYTDHKSLNKINKTGHLWHDNEHFILTFPGGSADVDGSTLYYFSKDHAWTIFHNDSPEASKHLEKLLMGMRDCQDQDT